MELLLRSLGWFFGTVAVLWLGHVAAHLTAMYLKPRIDQWFARLREKRRAQKERVSAEFAAKVNALAQDASAYLDARLDLIQIRLRAALSVLFVLGFPLRANIRETVDPVEFSEQGGEAKGA
jgi:hypothetical protein